jgi:hypothetical protein
MRSSGCGAATAFPALVSNADGGLVAMVALSKRDLIEHLVGTVHDGTHRVIKSTRRHVQALKCSAAVPVSLLNTNTFQCAT